MQDAVLTCGKNGSWTNPTDIYKGMKEYFEEGKAVLWHMLYQVKLLACDDVGPAICCRLVLPLIRERINAQALEYAERQACDLIAQLEVGAAWLVSRLKGGPVSVHAMSSSCHTCTCSSHSCNVGRSWCSNIC